MSATAPARAALPTGGGRLSTRGSAAFARIEPMAAMESPCLPMKREDELDRSYRMARMVGALRLVERDLAALAPRDPADDAGYPLRLARAHVLALIDLLADIALQDD